MTWVLIVVLTTYRGGVGVVQQEFATQAACETARVAILKAHDPDGTIWVKSHGCHPLGLHDRSGRPLT